MSILNYNHNINEITSNNFKAVRGTILIPKMYLGKLDELKYNESFSIETLLTKFSFLINKKVIFISPNLEKHTTLYQGQPKVKLNLIRSHFRCSPLIWHQWKRLANHFGVSMCYLFIICLKKITIKQLDSVGTPTESRRLCNFFFFEITNFTRSYSHRWFYARSYSKKSKSKKK